ncbi:sensor histidine kinase [Helicobacter sp.]|uniref:sensor histidine kinase n=1 Tax=Helicobacter sp. TaxID=218 RepID=UPI0025BD5D19|nr:HAMP domain-containing sensor histidine kinase [Helicobacter sp.]MCI5968038.1 HAMP domain-containing histidine kinase [Helicobacter sp.]MDY2585149.1 HAMP domain-containing sensor histidine kinase [Helicobacter sp.]
MQKVFICAFIAFLAVLSILFYVYAHTTTYDNIESKLQKIAHQYFDDTLLEGVAILDFKTPSIAFKKHINAGSLEYVLQIPFQDKTLQIAQDITQEVRLLNLLGLALVFLNVIVWMMIAVLMWQNKRNLKEQFKGVITALNALKVKHLNPITIPKTPITQALIAFLERIETYYTAQKQLYSGIAHELKTPLAVIKAKCEVTLLKQRKNEMYVDALRENIKSVDEAQASIKVLFDLMHALPMENAKRIDVQSVLESIVRDFALLHKDRKFDCILQTQGLEIPIKLVLLRQIVQNFLQNAFKFTPKDKAVCLKSYVENGILKIEVLDEGGGIATDFDVFAPFKRSGEQEGMGLGLFLANKAATALGGSVTLENRKDKSGAVATFKLKLVQ